MATAHKSEARSPVIEGLQHSGLPVALTLAALVIGLAALLPLIQSSGATSTVGNVHTLQQERNGWQARLHEMEVEVARLGSLDRIEQEARARLGMSEPRETYYIRVDAPPPLPQRIPGQYLPQGAEGAHAGSSLWEDLFGWLPLP